MSDVGTRLAGAAIPVVAIGSSPSSLAKAPKGEAALGAGGQ